MNVMTWILDRIFLTRDQREFFAECRKRLGPRSDAASCYPDAEFTTTATDERRHYPEDRCECGGTYREFTKLPEMKNEVLCDECFSHRPANEVSGLGND